MNDSVLNRLRSDAKKIFQASLDAVDPYKAVKRFMKIDHDTMILGEMSPVKLDMSLYNRIFLVGGGKATAPMARAVEDVLGTRISKGIINVKYGFGEDLKITVVNEAGHPLPDHNSVEGTAKILALLEDAGEKDLVISLISGGGSALLTRPADGISLSDKQEITSKLLECGASIDEINTVRKHISASKGGQMAKVAYPATTINFMLSDVVGDRKDIIASGPFVPDSSTFQDAQRIIDKYALSDIPHTIKEYIKAGMEGKVFETPKEGDPIFERVFNFIVGSNILALISAEKEARSLGYNTVILSSMVEGETKEVAHVHSAIAREIVKTDRPVSPPACVISGGETTVTIHGDGLGGRNQEFCLASALDIKNCPPRMAVMSCGTDGNDGPTDAAGAIVDPLTVKRGENMGMDALDYLMRNDSYNYFKKTGELVITGPTKTNVMDVRLILVR